MLYLVTIAGGKGVGLLHVVGDKVTKFVAIRGTDVSGARFCENLNHLLLLAFFLQDCVGLPHHSLVLTLGEVALL